VIDGLVRDCKVFINDMIITTKVGKKWSEGIKDFLSKIQACSTNIALEAAVIAGKYHEAKVEIKEANDRLMRDTNSMHEQQRPKRLYVSAVKGNPQPRTPDVEEDDIMIVDVPEGKIPVKDRLGAFPPLNRQTSKKGRNRNKNKANTDKLKAARMKPVKPAFLVDGKDGSVSMSAIWNAVSKATKVPKLDGCRKNADGNYVITSTDSATMEAIRTINGDLSIRELGPRKPRVKLKGIPTEHTAEDIVGMILSQNQELSACSTEDIRPLFRCGKRNMYLTDWVIEVSPKAYKLLNGKRIYVGMISTFPRPFMVAPYCRKCLLTTHKTPECKEEKFTCFHCAKPGHNRADCPNKGDKPKCAHCDGEHTTLSKDCAKWAAKVRALQLKTSYE